MLEVLLHATMKVLKLDEDDALTVLRQRLLKPKRADDEGTKVLLEFDEAMKCVEPADADVIGTEQKQTVEDGSAHAEIVGEWQQKRQAAKAKKSSQASNKKRKPSDNSKAKAPPPPRLPANFEMVDQKLAKTFMPEGGLIWKSRGAGAWISKINGFNECSRSVSRYGESEALRIVIANAWKDWCLDQGVPFDQCPMQGLPELSDD